MSGSQLLSSLAPCQLVGPLCRHNLCSCCAAVLLRCCAAVLFCCCAWGVSLWAVLCFKFDPLFVVTSEFNFSFFRALSTSTREDRY